MLGGSRGSRIWVLIAAVNEFKRAEATASHSPKRSASARRDQRPSGFLQPEWGREQWTGDVGLFSASLSHLPPGPLLSSSLCVIVKLDLLTSTIKGMLTVSLHPTGGRF